MEEGKRAKVNIDEIERRRNKTLQTVEVASVWLLFK